MIPHYEVNKIPVYFDQDWRIVLSNLLDDREFTLITSKGWIRRGITGKIKKTGLNLTRAIEVDQSHPDLADTWNAYETFHGKPDQNIVAVGGGSVLDLAKICSVERISNYDNFESFLRLSNHLANYKILSLINIPTTLGTASDLTNWATVWDHKRRQKYSFELPNLYPVASIVDPSLTLSLPVEYIVASALDTFSQAFDAIWNKKATEDTNHWAGRSIHLVYENLELAIDNPTNLQYRSNLAKAVIYMGNAFTQTKTSLSHALSYYLTLNKKIPHGFACALWIPSILEFIIENDPLLLSVFESLGLSIVRLKSWTEQVLEKHLDKTITQDDIGNILKSIIDNPRSKNSVISASGFLSWYQILKFNHV